MNQKPRRIVNTFTVTVICLFIGVAIAYIAGLRINTTRSIPLGLYRLSTNPIEKGAYVLFCPPLRPAFDLAKERGYIGPGFCPGGYGYMMKRVFAVQHDVVSVSDEGVTVNGHLLLLSTPIDADSNGQPLPHYRLDQHVLGTTEWLLMSDSNARSFDARYFGPIESNHIRSVIHPLWTW